MQSMLTGNGPAAPAVKDTTTAGFKADVIDASMQTPVIVDFWAPWCGPCKTLGPMLEKAVAATRGKVRMVKLDIDKNQALAQQMRIQSIPAVYAFFQGRPVDAFVGALPESQVKAFVDKLAKLGAGEGAAIEDALAEAKQLAEAGDHQGAGEIYSQIVQHDPTVAAALAGLARALIALNDPKGAAKAIEQAPDAVRKSPEVTAVKTLLDLSRETAGAAAKVPELMARLAKDKADHQARYDLSLALYGAGKRDAAVDELLEITRRDREWNEQAARKQLLKLFEAFGPTDPLTVSGRRRLSSILFS